jgi:hypothetical protein
MWTNRECLLKGYPEHRVSITLERYCLTLDGSVQVRVDALK